MSSLIFYVDEEQALIATDTLAVTHDGAPFLFCSKAIHLPHLNIVIAGTGQGGFATRWALTVNDRMVINGINNLDFHTPNGLREHWNQYIKEFNLPPEATTTVYHFGFCQDTNKMVAIAYRSTNNFVSEILPYGLAAKPECSFPEGEYEVPAIFSEMMLEQRSIQEAKPREDRIYIGGKINVIHINNQACSSYTLSEFSDCALHEKMIFDSYGESC